MTTELLTLDVENIDEVEFDEFFAQIHSHLSGEEEISSTAPKDNIGARKWLTAATKIEDKITYFKGDYKKFLKKRYLDPVDKKVEQLEKSVDFIKEGLLQFLNATEEKNIPFPDLATVSKVSSKDKIVYPEDEEAFAEALHNSGEEDFVVTKFRIDKKAINKAFKDSGELPVSGLATEETSESVRITRAKIDA